MKFEPLSPKFHDRKSFDCGVKELNLYIQQFANQDQVRSLTKVYVLSDGPTIIGYYSICAHSVSRENLPENQKIGPYNDLPFLLLGRLAVDHNFQGKGYGDALIFHAFKTTLNAAETVGILGIVVDALNENVVSYYEGFGFMRLKGTQNRFVISISTMKHLLETR
ncbi:MAG: GNAT family N-acetyltransferase [Candidatus Hinthialibacter antarcticus]|nr:GNAT family N-acetyltransferase [Candidatus Hinthialibacter antarcticus]